MKTVASINLTTVPVVKTDKKGHQYVTFGAAEDVQKKNTDGTFEKIGVTYMSVTAYGSHAMKAALDLHKGDRVEITGEPQMNVEIGNKKLNFFKLKDAKVLFRKGEKEFAKAA